MGEPGNKANNRHVSALCIYPVQVVGEALRECVSHDVCVWVVARALDALYDVFGADECPTQLFSTLQIMPVLKHIASQFTARVGGDDYNSYTLYSCAEFLSEDLTSGQGVAG